MLKSSPSILYDALVRAIWWPVHYSDVFVSEPLFCKPSCVLGVIVLLKKDIIDSEIIVLEGTEKSFIKYLAVLDSIHGVFHQNQPCKAQTCHASPDHHPPTPHASTEAAHYARLVPHKDLYDTTALHLTQRS